MTPTSILQHEFVKTIPETLKDGTLYVSVDYATAAHKCCCGCGREVVTPLSPTDWKFTYDGQSISLFPSIGNWNFECRSHYWIDGSRVMWADQWSDEMIATGRARDRLAKSNYYADQQSAVRMPAAGVSEPAGNNPHGDFGPGCTTFGRSNGTAPHKRSDMEREQKQGHHGERSTICAGDEVNKAPGPKRSRAPWDCDSLVFRATTL